MTEWVEAKGLPEQRTTRYSYDQYSQLTSTTKGAGDASGADAITQSWKHDNSGNIVEFMDGEKNKFFEKYNSIGFFIEALDPDGGKKMNRHNNSGNITEILDSEKSIETIAYDALNRRIQTKSALGRVANIKYDASGGVSEFQNPYNVSDVGVVIEYNKHGQISKSISPSGYYVINSYDESGRLVSASDSVGNKLVYEYGVYGGENAGLLVAVHYPSYSELYKYDVLGRRVQVIDVFNENDKRVRSVQYNAIGERVAVTNSLGFVTLFGYDGLGRLTLTIGPSGGQSKYKYNINNQILNFIDGIGNKHDYFYNKTGQVVKTISPAGASSLFEYSKTGKLLFKKDADGNVKELRYDQFGDLIKEVYKNSESMVTQYIDYVNDLEGRIIQYEQKNYDGKLLSSAKYERNLQGEIIGSQINYGMVDDVGKIGFSFRSQYDEDGRLVKHIYPDASVQTYHYDGYNLSRLVTPAGETVSYDGYLNGKPGRVIMPGSEKSIEYDSVYRIKRISILSNGANLRQDEYLYDSADNIVRIKNKTGEVVYKYDSENRLIVAKPSAEMDGFGFEEEGYAYDAAGNRSFSLHQPGTWVYEGNHLVNYPRRDLIDKKTYEVKTAYDLRGNIKNEISSNDKLTFKYNEANRLINFENNKLNASYEYDPFGRRISKRVKNGNHIDVTYYLYHEYGLMAEFDSAGVMKKAYGWEGGVKNADWSTNPVWQAEVIDGDLKGKGTIYNYFHNNHLGAPLLVVDKEGHISWMATYEPFGSVKISNNSIEMNLRFPGQYWDKESDTHYNLYRNYSPQTGRYLQADPIGLKGGSNFYSYASSNPIMYYDPQGLESQPCCQPKMTEHDCCGTLPTTDDDLFNLPPIASGTVMCCQGKKIRCLSKSYDHARFGKEIKRKCAELHEDTHQNHVKECPNDCSYFINPIDVSKFTKETAECDAYGAEINCLLNRMPECGNDPTCIFALKRSIASSKDKMKEYKCSM